MQLHRRKSTSVGLCVAAYVVTARCCSRLLRPKKSVRDTPSSLSLCPVSLFADPIASLCSISYLSSWSHTRHVTTHSTVHTHAGGRTIPLPLVRALESGSFASILSQRYISMSLSSSPLPTSHSWPASHRVVIPRITPPTIAWHLQARWCLGADIAVAHLRHSFCKSVGRYFLRSLVAT